jgi:hypothetical protein
MRTISITNIPAWLAVALATASAVALAACVPTTPRLDAQFGAAVEMARARQTANPDASGNIDVVKGIDGQAGAAAVNNYRESFINPRPAPTGGVVNVGTGKAGSGGGMGGR